MIDLKNIRSLSDFQRNTKAHIKRLKRTGKPQVLTVNGEAELVVQSTGAYQQLLDALEEAEAVEAIRRSLESADRGEGRPMREFLEELGRKHGIDLKKTRA